MMALGKVDFLISGSEGSARDGKPGSKSGKPIDLSALGRILSPTSPITKKWHGGD
jgi:hypothetical protein